VDPGTRALESLKVLDPKRPIREADVAPLYNRLTRPAHRRSSPPLDKHASDQRCRKYSSRHLYKFGLMQSLRGGNPVFSSLQKMRKVFCEERALVISPFESGLCPNGIVPTSEAGKILPRTLLT
jgi:hypothetical protein